MADQKINGALYRSMVIEGALAIAEKKEQANELNVFPVPDGDTGTNMSMTMGSAMAEMEKLAEPEPCQGRRCDRLCAAARRARQLGCYPVAAVPRHGEKAARDRRGRRPAHSRLRSARAWTPPTRRL